MKKATLILMLLAAMMVGVTSCNGGGDAEGGNADTTHTEGGDGHAH